MRHRDRLIRWVLFQSTPPAEARGDFTQVAAIANDNAGFQSTPPAEARGDQ